MACECRRFPCPERPHPVRRLTQFCRIRASAQCKPGWTLEANTIGEATKNKPIPLRCVELNRRLACIRVSVFIENSHIHDRSNLLPPLPSPSFPLPEGEGGKALLPPGEGWG
jgi:hypothetical protein